MRSTSACGGSHLVAQPVSGGLHSFLGAGAQRGANAALAGTGHGFSEMHALSIFGVKVSALNIEKKSAVRLCKTWQDNILCQTCLCWSFDPQRGCNDVSFKKNHVFVDRVAFVDARNPFMYVVSELQQVHTNFWRITFQFAHTHTRTTLVKRACS